ncbi:sulfur reduction protein DsrE [Xanthomarina sp. F2636L]|uniref:sulfur reduction protein DsrE n=1 Tax=Xanthomarina sp. F2636L TaxID=2996018 RepID=UPI00225E328B|nr:sulfur reduction protein DsrE [Xanthomarina sp. F2636L]MCX7550356.1 sulfur reduction protein DsrE [Xanthomarina sp. F2636L]
MKTYLFNSIFVLLTLFSITEIKAQQINNDKNNYVVLTKKVPQLQPIILAAEALKTEDGENFGNFEVIICGQEIGDITNPEKINNFIKKAKETGIEIIACGFSLNKFKVERTQVPKNMKIVENGILYNLQLQKKGYKSITL